LVEHAEEQRWFIELGKVAGVRKDLDPTVGYFAAQVVGM
jgi:hypothetical protein